MPLNAPRRITAPAESGPRTDGPAGPRVTTRDLDRVAYASDASHYLLTPHAVAVARHIADVAELLRQATARREPLTFRSGGTSLSGQASTDGLLVDVGEGLFYPPSAIEQARQICRTTLSKLGSATLSQLREAWGVTRKYAVPLGEFFDAHGLTLRDGDLRRAGPRLELPWQSVE